MEETSPKDQIDYQNLVERAEQVDATTFKVEYKDESVYVGEVREGRRQGQGKYTFPNQEFLEGTFVADKLEGKGVYSTEQLKYEGDWVDGFQEGQGTETWKDGSVYTGGFKGGDKHGYGEYKWGDGAAFKGDWCQGEIHGQGEFLFKNGSRY